MLKAAYYLDDVNIAGAMKAWSREKEPGRRKRKNQA